MGWTIKIDPRAADDLKKLDRTIAKDITDYLNDRIAPAADPRSFGKPLRGVMFGLWRYRVRDYRIVLPATGKNLVVLVVEVGHRSTIYDE